jgi:hypothetical protein
VPDVLCLWVGRIFVAASTVYLMLELLNLASGFVLRCLRAQKAFVIFMWNRNRREEARRD